MSDDLYKFTIADGAVTGVYEYDDGRWEADSIESNEVYTLLPDGTVQRAETYATHIEVKIYSPGDVAGTFVRTAEFYTSLDGTPISGSPDGLDHDLDDDGSTDDSITCSSGNDVVYSRDGDDEVHGRGGNDSLNGGRGHDDLYGEAGDDRLNGGDGSDDLYGGTGGDTMAGGLGDDSYRVDSTRDSVAEAASAGTDTVYSSIGYTLGANLEKLVLTGTGANAGLGNGLGNSLMGNAAANRLAGGGGDDVLMGGGGDDRLNGGSGADNLIGGAGHDRFVFNSVIGSSIDRLGDFRPVDDTIELENAIFAKLTATGTLSGANFRASAGGDAADANDHILYDTTTGALYYDADGSGAGAKVQFATAWTGTGHPALTAADFIVV